MRLKSSESILDLLDVNKFPASENNLSDNVDVAGIVKNILAIFANTEYLFFLFNYQLNGHCSKGILSSFIYSFTSSDAFG